LGRALSLNVAQIYDKIVVRGRGGWCYEMNSLFAWALGELGYDVTLLASDVTDEFVGDGSTGEHLVLLVKLDRAYLVDVGFGNGLQQPISLEVGTYQQGFLTYGLLNDGERWYFRNQAYGGAGFVFTLQPRAIADFAPTCHHLQTAPESGFVRTAVCHRSTPPGIVTLRGAVLRTVSEQGVSDQIVDNSASYEQVLNNTFNLWLPQDEIAMLWERVWARHQVWIKENS
jgi:N-hydroxyarylamine O-acetyltransferase